MTDDARRVLEDYDAMTDAWADDADVDPVKVAYDRPTILAMKPGTRVVSHQYGMGDWEPDESETVDSSRVMFWRVPAKVAGQWMVQFGDGPARRTLELRLDQRYQRVEGEGSWDGSRRPLSEVRLSGTRRGQDVAGNGYVELTGYARSMQDVF